MAVAFKTTANMYENDNMYMYRLTFDYTTFLFPFTAKLHIEISAI